MKVITVNGHYTSLRELSLDLLKAKTAVLLTSVFDLINLIVQILCTCLYHSVYNGPNFYTIRFWKESVGNS